MGHFKVGFLVILGNRGKCHAEMMQYSSGIRGDRHHLIDVPLRSDGDTSLCNITISQRSDGSDWLLGKGSSGKVTPKRLTWLSCSLAHAS